MVDGPTEIQNTWARGIMTMTGSDSVFAPKMIHTVLPSLVDG